MSRPCSFGPLACAFAALPFAALAVAGPAAAATPTSYLQNGAIVGTGQTITISRLPVRLGNGALAYKDVTIQLDVSANGTLTYADTRPLETNSPNPLVSGIKNGVYGDSANTNVQFSITGPGVMTGGNGEYSITRTGAYCAVAQPGVFYSGPVGTTPIGARVKAAGINTGQYRLGVVGQEACGLSFNYANFPSHGLIGLAQVGTTLVVSSFTDSSGKDYPTPVNQVNYVLVQ